MRGSMQNVAPLINHAHRGGMLGLAFLSEVVSLWSRLPRRPRRSPCTTSTGRKRLHQRRYLDGHRRLRRRHHRRTVGAGTTSNHLGRRLTAIASLGLLLLGCLLLLNVHDIGTLLAGRLLVGVGTGLASSSLTSYIVDGAPSRPDWLASVASSQGRRIALRHRAARRRPAARRSQLFSGFHIAMAVAAGTCVLATLVVFIIEPGPHVDFMPR